ncbi:MAG: DNA-binding protein WhiA [Clostridiales bacterium]|nr:DNA-binding protein WhiA [Clostridiales bacterium]
MPTISGLDVKKEIISFRLKEGERKALLSGFVRSCMTMTMSFGKGMLLGLDCQTDFVKEYISAAMMEQFKMRPKSDEDGFVYADCEKLLRRLYILDPDSDSFEVSGIPDKFDEHRYAYVRGMFLGSGSFSAHEVEDKDGPSGTGGRYHLEFSVLSESLADELIELLNTYGIKVRKMERVDKYVVYSKDSDSVCNCLALMRLDNLVLKLQETVATLSFKKDINRRVNFEMANMTRTTNAAVDVAEALELIAERKGLDSLSPKLLEAAEARQNAPDKTLAELAYELGISKSGLKHRYDKIIEIADKLRDN